LKLELKNHFDLDSCFLKKVQKIYPNFIRWSYLFQVTQGKSKKFSVFIPMSTKKYRNGIIFKREVVQVIS